MASSTTAPAAASASLRSDFLRTLVERGFLHQCTDLEGLDVAAASERVTGYIGFDATADSLHVGSLVQIMMLRHMQRTGHRPIVLMGGGTTRVGDPSGKDKSRQLLSNAQIADNIAGIRRIFERFLDFGHDAALMADNSDWLDALHYIPFLRDYGRHFSVNRMLGFESVKQRLDREQPLSFLEFNYMVLQAYDFVELGRRHGCHLQMGGSDQWGNIVCGVELGRRVASLTLFGLTSPLLTTAGGAKMGKTADGAVWLNPDRFSPYEYWQYWRNTEDADVGRFLRLFTELPLDEIVRLEALEGAEINEAKVILATETTTLCHGREAAEAAMETAGRTFGPGAGLKVSASTGVPNVRVNLKPPGLKVSASTGIPAVHINLEGGLPTINIPRARIDAGVPVYELLREAGLAKSNSEGRRLIRGGGARVNDERFTDETGTVGPDDLTSEGTIKLSAGKKRHALVRVT
ncbi:MAG: tyrosine--tRNA ligase [Thiotrichales bacterium]|nr:tyrosine--tRNA ligase [Thiotrichales bacterium]